MYVARSERPTKFGEPKICLFLLGRRFLKFAAHKSRIFLIYLKTIQSKTFHEFHFPPIASYFLEFIR